MTGSDSSQRTTIQMHYKHNSRKHRPSSAHGPGHRAIHRPPNHHRSPAASGAGLRTWRAGAVFVGVLVVCLGLSGAAIAREGNSPVAPADPLPAEAVSLFADTEQPADVMTNRDANSVELGLTFTTSQDGTMAGLRYFRSVGDSSAHSGRLWSSTGKLLGRLHFPTRATAGWQYAAFPVPVWVAAGDVLTASYHSTVGEVFLT